MAKFLDYSVGLPQLWSKIKALVQSTNDELYYHPGDSETGWFYTSGMLTGSSLTLRAFIPIQKNLSKINSVSFDFKSMQLRAVKKALDSNAVDGGYIISNATNNIPTGTTFEEIGTNGSYRRQGLYVLITFPNGTTIDVPNNTPFTGVISGTITFS